MAQDGGREIAALKPPTSSEERRARPSGERAFSCRLRLVIKTVTTSQHVRFALHRSMKLIRNPML
jgi:hypothetical protein